MIKKLIILTTIILVVIGAGCATEELPRNAPAISGTPAVVPASEASSAPDELMPKTKMAMPCLQFKHKEGFLNWLEAYSAGGAEQAIKMAQNINLPDKPEAQLIEALKTSQAPGALQTSLCNIHKQLGIFTWAVEFADATQIYTYRNPNHEQITVAMAARTEAGQEITSSTDLTKLGMPLCLPKTITSSELIWFCGTPYEAWKEVHVNRKMGNMVQLQCEPNAEGKPALGCLDPTAEQ